MAARKTSKAKQETTAADIAPAITIKEADADVRRRKAHEKNMEAAAKEKGSNIPQGKPLNEQTFEFVCDDCLDKAVDNGIIYCLEEIALKDTGKCACGKLTTNKAIAL